MAKSAKRPIFATFDQFSFARGNLTPGTGAKWSQRDRDKAMAAVMWPKDRVVDADLYRQPLRSRFSVRATVARTERSVRVGLRTLTAVTGLRADFQSAQVNETVTQADWFGVLF